MLLQLNGTIHHVLPPSSRGSQLIEYSYTQAIDNTSKDDKSFIRDVYRKRAYANLTSKRFDVALEDAISSSSGNSQDGKAQYCAGRAAYELGQYEESRYHFEKALEASPRDLKYRKDLNRAVRIFLDYLYTEIC